MLKFHLLYPLIHQMLRIKLKPLTPKRTLRYTLQILMTLMQQVQFLHIRLQLPHHIDVALPVDRLVCEGVPVEDVVD
jgi:hypothetical protein